MEARLLAAIALLSAGLLEASAASAHPGGTNKSGCHTNKKSGDYHCHGGGGGGGGAPATAPPAPVEPVGPTPEHPTLPANLAKPEPASASKETTPLNAEPKAVAKLKAKPASAAVPTIDPTPTNDSARRAGYAVGQVLGTMMAIAFVLSVVAGLLLGARAVVRRLR